MPAKKQHPDDQTPLSGEDQVDDNNENVVETDAEGIGAEAAVDDVSDEGEDEVAGGDDAELIEEEDEPLTEKLQQAEARAEEYLDSLQRERASFQNYKKRVERERMELQQLGAGNLLLRLLPVLDDFHRAMDAVPEDERDEWFEGVALIQRKLERFLEDEGVTEIEALGQPFDPNFHEAVGVDDEADADPETVTEVLQRGYLHQDRVLRPAMVRVAG
ncbi:MAG: nucleotide exchange factor GrpE [Chloroflexi bacterium]|nr:nucleotide exchange factor GrpE [Chloroflexota bacterium]